MADRVLFQGNDKLDEPNLTGVAAKSNQTDYVERGISLTADYTNLELDTTSGHAVIATSTGDQAWDVFPDARTALTLTDNAVNEVYLVVDPNAQDALTVDVRTTGTPSDPYVKIGEVDTSADTTSEVNRDPAASFRAADIKDVSVTGQLSRNPGADGYIFRAGGNSIYSESEVGNDNRFQVYDVMKDEWAQLPPMQKGRGSHAMCYYNGGIWVFGGNNAEAETHVERYDVRTNQWQTKPSLNYPRFKLSKKMPVINGNVYICGGQNRDTGNRSNTVEKYDLDAETVTEVTSMPATHSFPMQAYYNGYLWLLTGNTDDAVETGLVQRYDPDTDTWDGPSNFTPHPDNVTDGAGTQVGDEFHMIGGWTPDTSDNPIPGTHHAYSFDTDTWTKVRDLPTGYSHGSAAYDGTYIWRFMGRCWRGDAPNDPDKNETSSVWRYHQDRGVEASVQRCFERVWNFTLLHTNDSAARPVGRE
ncbi:Kelch repeat-containing protein [Haloarchaeobius sp. HRN-SO-5]|uniref:Kelch repeat-containing protein n=1 Tax=Haloarchaeobius sp. HRN-SO-5 TaxID=3446118 RepID=UPI003EBF0B27